MNRATIRMWPELPSEIVELISKRLTVYGDYLRFRFICQNWRSSIPKTPLLLPPQLPWLMISPQTFFDLSTEKTHIIDLPLSAHSNRICGSSHGWLVILDETPKIRILNPITRATLNLPSLDSFPNVVSFDYSNIGREYVIKNPFGGLDGFNLKQMCRYFLRKVVLSTSPSLNGKFAALAITCHSNLAFYAKGSEFWILMSEEPHFWEDAVYHNGLFYAVSKMGLIAVCDVESTFPPHIEVHETKMPVGFFAGDVHYAVFSGEEFLLVTRKLATKAGDGGNMVFYTVGFEVFKMNWEVFTWEKVETLGDRVLFIGENSSLCFSASDYVGCYADCIYFTDNYSECNLEDTCGKHDFGIFRLRDQSIEPLPCYPHNSYCLSGWLYPVWVTPNPC